MQKLTDYDKDVIKDMLDNGYDRTGRSPEEIRLIIKRALTVLLGVEKAKDEIKAATIGQGFYDDEECLTYEKVMDILERYI